MKRSLPALVFVAALVSCDTINLLPACGNGLLDVGEECDDGNAQGGDGCSAACTVELCGDGVVDVGEECDDGNNIDRDGCDADCSLTTVAAVDAGFFHTCALLDTGKVRCWGQGSSGQLGYGNRGFIGDNETPASAGDVNVDGTVVQLVTGSFHNCALLDTGAVRCWGDSFDGQLGYGNTDNIGDDETPASVGDVNVGGTVVQIAAGASHTCALLDTGNVRCWGFGFTGRLGYGNENTIGDNETPASAGDVDVGGTVVQIDVGASHTCALLDTGNVRCWGNGILGRLGYGNTQNIGDNETPASAGDVNVGGTVSQIAVGDFHNCALLETGAVRCWGQGIAGQLGYGNTDNLGDGPDEMPPPDVSVF